MKKSISLLLLSLLMITPSCQKPKEVTNEYNIVPQPNQLVPKEGRFELSNKVRLVVPSDAPEVKKVADGFAEQLKQTAGISLKEAESVDGKPAISFVLQEGMPKEGYKLSVTPTLITVTASQPNGFFYGVQTIYQLLPPAVYGKELKKKADWSVPAVEIEDAPRFVHRGLMLDVCRHYAPIEYIYKFIDLLAMNKMNVFHWHLTDDQGWRIEIKKYPKLTEIGSKREKTLVDYYYVNYPQVFDGIEHGGYYTQEQIKEVVAYAASKYINVIPEIEMPGHALAALAAYPELSCDSTQTYKVSPTWGVFEQVFCPSETTFKFFEGVMDEVVELFPSEYIHIGGDEVPKDRWKECNACQKAIREHGLKNTKLHTAEERLQRTFNEEIAVYLHGLGKRMIGWDEVLADDLNREVIVMSWRGLGRATAAIRKGHDGIVSADSHLYLNHYQTINSEQEPRATGGLVEMKKVFETPFFSPQLTETERTQVLGAEACLWSSFVDNDSILDYMLLPRLAAFADAVWCEGRRGTYNHFLQRLPSLLRCYEQLGYGYARHFFTVSATYTSVPDDKCLVVSLESLPDTKTYYTLDGSQPTKGAFLYENPLRIDKSCILKAVSYLSSGLASDELSKEVVVNKATFKPIHLQNAPSERYQGEDGKVLVDGVRSINFHNTGLWVGYHAADMIATIDLEYPQEINAVEVSALTDLSAWIMGPQSISVYISSNGKRYKMVAHETYQALTDAMGEKSSDLHRLSFKKSASARFVKVIAVPFKGLPKGHSGEGEPPFLFVDEIRVH